MSEQKLKPCPFCGGKANLHTDAETSLVGTSIAGAGRRFVMISCLSCGVRTPHILEDVEYCAVDKVKEIWEKRVGE